MNRRRRDQRGSALLVALILLMVLGIGSAATWRALHFELEGTRVQGQQATAYFLAEAGLEKAVAMLRLDPAYTGEADTPLGAGGFTVRVTPLEPGAYHIESTGTLADVQTRQGRHVLTARLRLDPAGRLLEYAVYRKGAHP
jgi:hypothetical protein